MDLLHEITEAVSMPGFKVRVRFDTGESGVFDCSNYLGHPYWKRLADPAFFKLVRVAYGTLVWPDDIDIAPEDVWEKTIRDSAPRPEYAESSDETIFVAEDGLEYDSRHTP